MSSYRSTDQIRVTSKFDAIRGSHIRKIYKAFQFAVRVAHHYVSKIRGESTPRWTSLKSLINRIAESRKRINVHEVGILSTHEYQHCSHMTGQRLLQSYEPHDC
jgi:hypothetical protein